MSEQVRPNEAAVASRAPRRPRHVLLGIACGFAIAYAIGVIAVNVIDNDDLTGSPDRIVTYLLGLPMLIAIAGGVFGAMISVLTYVEEVDAPVREDADHNLVIVDETGASDTADPSRDQAEQRGEHASVR